LTRPRSNQESICHWDGHYYGAVEGVAKFQVVTVAKLTSCQRPQGIPAKVKKSNLTPWVAPQYLCELIKKSHFDGVKFQSSVGDGVNFTLFGQSKVKALSVLSHYVKGLEYSTEKI
jgi:hypothetical protein